MDSGKGFQQLNDVLKFEFQKDHLIRTKKWGKYEETEMNRDPQKIVKVRGNDDLNQVVQ